MRQITRFFLIVFGSIYSVSLFAFPIVPINGLLHQDCEYTSSQRTFADLIHRVNIIGRDDRGPLTTMGPAIGLSADEIHRIRETTGYIYCPGTKYHNGESGSAALISDREIITAAHLLYDDQGRPRAPWSACYFEAQTGGKMTRIPLEFKEDESFFGSKFPSRSMADHRRDIAIIRLKTKILGVKPFAISSTPISMDEKIYGISAEQNGFQKDWREPIVESCNPQQIFDSYSDTPTGYYSDCDAEGGSSGGVNLVRRNGKLVIVGITTNSGSASNDYKSYDPDHQSFTYSVGIDGRLAEKAAELAGVKLIDGPKFSGN